MKLQIGERIQIKVMIVYIAYACVNYMYGTYKHGYMTSIEYDISI